MMIEICGIYAIKNKTNGRCYVGASKDVHTRMKAHVSALNSGRHKTLSLQRDWMQYTEKGFSFGVLQAASCAKELTELERHWMIIMEKSGDLYNGSNQVGYPQFCEDCVSGLNNPRDERQEVSFMLYRFCEEIGEYFDMNWGFTVRVKKKRNRLEGIYVDLDDMKY